MTTSAARSAPAALLDPPSAMTPSPRDSREGPLGQGACRFDWIELDEAFRSCSSLAPTAPPWKPSVRIEPKELRVAAGGKVRFRVTLSSSDAKGAWTASLDDHCGQALRPIFLDEKEAPIEHPSLWYAPACPSRVAEVTLSRRGRVTALVDVLAVERVRERVVVGHKTLPGGKIVNVEEERIKEVPLPGGRYNIELLLPTPDTQSTVIPIEVVPVAPP